MFGWAMTGCLRKYITLWGYFWFFECKWPKTSQNSHILRIFYLINNSKLDFFRKPSLNHLDFNCSKSSFVSIFIIYILLASVIFFNSTLLPDQWDYSLLDKLEQSGFGCTIDGVYASIFGFSNDDIALAPIFSTLEGMMKVIEKLCKDHGLQFFTDPNTQKLKTN